VTFQGQGAAGLQADLARGGWPQEDTPARWQWRSACGICLNFIDALKAKCLSQYGHVPGQDWIILYNMSRCLYRSCAAEL
jgi:hypothetical protein